MLVPAIAASIGGLLLLVLVAVLIVIALRRRAARKVLQTLQTTSMPMQNARTASGTGTASRAVWLPSGSQRHGASGDERPFVSLQGLEHADVLADTDAGTELEHTDAVHATGSDGQAVRLTNNAFYAPTVPGGAACSYALPHTVAGQEGHAWRLDDDPRHTTDTGPTYSVIDLLHNQASEDSRSASPQPSAAGEGALPVLHQNPMYASTSDADSTLGKSFETAQLAHAKHTVAHLHLNPLYEGGPLESRDPSLPKLHSNPLYE
jgi:hypothetical protein